MARTRTFGTDWFGTLNTETAPHLIDAGHLQEAVNVSRDVRGALSPSASDTSVYQTPDHNIAGMKAVRYGGANHVIVATPDWLYVDNVLKGSSCGPSTTRFVCDGERVYILSADGNNKVWDGTKLRSHGPFGSAWDDVSNDAENMLVSNDDTTPAGLTGVYRWAASYRVTTESGQIIESKLYPLWVDAGGDPDENYAGSVTLTAADGVMIYMRQVTQAEIDAWCADLGTGKVEGVFYRTVNGGVDYFQQSVVAQADITGNGRYGKYDIIPDADLGGEYLEADDAHGVPPTADVAVISQRRLFLVNREDRRIYFSGIGQYDYFGPLDWIDAEDSVYGLASIGDSIAVAYASGIRTFRLVDGIEQWSSVVSSVGTTSTDGIALCDYGLLFARDDGLYLFDGNSVRRVSDIIAPSWTAGSWRGAVVNGFGYYTNWPSGLTFEFKIINGVFTWSKTDNDQGVEQIAGVSEDPLDGYIWFRRMDGIIGKLHQGSSFGAMSAKTRDYGGGRMYRWLKALFDFSGTVVAVVTTNRGETETFALSSTGRVSVRKSLPISMTGELCNVQFSTSDGEINGVLLEAQ